MELYPPRLEHSSAEASFGDAQREAVPTPQASTDTGLNGGEEDGGKDALEEGVVAWWEVPHKARSVHWGGGLANFDDVMDLPVAEIPKDQLPLRMLLRPEEIQL